MQYLITVTKNCHLFTYYWCLHFKSARDPTNCHHDNSPIAGGFASKANPDSLDAHSIKKYLGLIIRGALDSLKQNIEYYLKKKSQE